MTDDDSSAVGSAVYVVYTDGPDGKNYPYGVFTSKDAAEEAREAIIKELESTSREELDDAERTLARQLTGSLDAQTRIKECELRSEFSQETLKQLFEDYD